MNTDAKPDKRVSGIALPILRTAELNTETYKKINAKLKHKGRQQNKAQERTHGRNNKLKNNKKLRKKIIIKT